MRFATGPEIRIFGPCKRSFATDETPSSSLEKREGENGVKGFVIAAAACLLMLAQGVTFAAEGRGGRGAAAHGPAAHGPAERPQPPNVITPTYTTTGRIE